MISSCRKTVLLLSPESVIDSAVTYQSANAVIFSQNKIYYKGSLFDKILYYDYVSAGSIPTSSFMNGITKQLHFGIKNY